MCPLSLKRILVPTDFSPHSRKAFRYAVDLARTFSGGIVLLHVIDTRIVDNVYRIHALAPEKARTEMRQSAETAMREMLSRETHPGVAVEKQFVEGIPSVEIKRVAGELSADLVVIGTHGATGLVQLLYGSTAEGVVRAAPCPVLTVNP